MAKRHWYTGLRGACKVPRSLLGWWYEIKPRAFLDRHALEPDRYCSDCAKAARLALAAESAPKPDAVVWPKPRPIAEAPKLECILAYVPESSDPHLKGRWLLMVATEDKEKIDGFTVLGANPAADRWFPCSILQPTHFLPLPPEVK